MKAVILGGTFNPVHYGHLFVAEEVREAFGYDTVIFVPANKPVHKDAGPVIPPSHRLEMLRRAVRGCEGFLVDECDITRGGASYSIASVEELAPRYGIIGKPGYIIGDDLADGFHTWKEAERLAMIVDLIVARRTAGSGESFAYPHKTVMNVVLPISSSEIRKRIREGRTVRFLTPDPVIQYIRENRLYG